MATLRTVGIVGGVTWTSTAAYYVRIQERIGAWLDPFRSAPLVIHSLDYGAVRDARADGGWRRLSRLVVAAARDLKGCGVDAVALASNSLHGAAGSVEAETGLPVLHVADAVAERARADGHERVGLLGTAFTMGQRFWIDRCRAAGVDVIAPDAATRAAVDRLILDELAAGRVVPASVDRLHAAADALVRDGATAVVLGCTELRLALPEGALAHPALDTVAVHADAVARFALGDPSGPGGPHAPPPTVAPPPPDGGGG